MTRPDDDFGPRGAPGRRLREPGEAPTAPTTPPSVATAPVPFDPAAPFAAHQADPASLDGAGNPHPANRALVLVPLTGLVAVAFGLLLVGALIAGWRNPGPTGPARAAEGPRHIADAGYDGTIVDPKAPPPPAERAPSPGPLKIFVDADRAFVSIEVDCPSSGYQRRGRFFPEGPGKMAASVPDVPPDEKCRVTFQGTEVTTTWAYAHDVRDCVSFNPTVCPAR